MANSIGFSAKIKEALGKAKIKQLLVPRFEAMTQLLNMFPALMERDAAFEREISEAGEKADILKTNSMRGQIRSGLKQLSEERWFSEKEYEAFNQKLA